MPTLAILAGLPGSGKSTAARRLRADRGFFVVSADGLRVAFNAGVYPRDAGGEYAALEPVVTEAARLAVRRLIEAGRDVAIDATHLTRERRAGWREFARTVEPRTRVEIHWCAGRWDSFGRWAVERGFQEVEYRALRQKLEESVEEPHADEADELVVHEPTVARPAGDIASGVQRVGELAARDLRHKGVFELLASASEELGELSRELLIEESVYGNAYKSGDEGSKAEAIDLAICALAIYFGRGGSGGELATTLHKKLDKWQANPPSAEPGTAPRSLPAPPQATLGEPPA